MTESMMRQLLDEGLEAALDILDNWESSDLPVSIRKLSTWADRIEAEKDAE